MDRKFFKSGTILQTNIYRYNYSNVIVMSVLFVLIVITCKGQAISSEKFIKEESRILKLRPVQLGLIRARYIMAVLICFHLKINQRLKMQ